MFGECSLFDSSDVSGRVEDGVRLDVCLKWTIGVLGLSSGVCWCFGKLIAD